MPGVQELEQAPQLAEVVLDRRAAQRQPVLAAEQPRRLRRLGRRVLDRLRLVEDRVVELDVLEVGARRGAACRRWSGPGRSRRSCSPGLPRPMPVWSSTRSCGREARGLLLPVEDQRPRHDDQRRRGPRRSWRAAARGAPRAARAPARSCRAPCRRPGSRRSRTRGGSGASRAPRAGSRAAAPVEPGRRVGRRDALEAAAAARAPARTPRRIAPRAARPAARRAGRPASAGTGGGRPPAVPSPARSPYFFSHSSGSRPKLPSPSGTRSSPRLQGREQRGQLAPRVAEVDAAVQLEPVDPGRDLDVERAGLAVELALRLDAPAFSHQLGHGARQAARRQLQRHLVALAPPEGSLLEPEHAEPRGSRLLRGGIPSDEAAALGIDDRRARQVGRDLGAVVFEGQLAEQPVPAPLGWPGTDPQPGSRTGRDFFVAQRFWHLDSRKPGQAEETIQQLLSVRGRNAKGAC